MISEPTPSEIPPAVKHLEILHEAIAIVGSQQTVADACGVSQPAVTGWLKRGGLPNTEFVPGDRPDHTRYAEIIAQLCAQAGRPDFTAHYILYADRRDRSSAVAPPGGGRRISRKNTTQPAGE